MHQGDLAQKIAKCIQDKEENKKLQEQYTTKKEVLKPQYDSKQVNACMQMKSQQEDSPDDLSRFAVKQVAPTEMIVQESQASGVSETAGGETQVKHVKVSCADKC